jgi:hypothetical protein
MVTLKTFHTMKTKLSFLMILKKVKWVPFSCLDGKLNRTLRRIENKLHKIFELIFCNQQLLQATLQSY